MRTTPQTIDEAGTAERRLSQNLTDRLTSLTRDQERRALLYLWGIMSVRDIEACEEAIDFACGTPE